MTNQSNLRDFTIKGTDYYSTSRLDMIDYIPKNAKKILDVGCAEGMFGKRLKEKLNAEVWGIEINEKVANVAQKNLDKVIIGNVGNVINDIPERYFDCIVFNDVLEHLNNPYRILLKAKKLLSKDGVIVCSIPNIRYFPVLKDLLVKKQWKYEDAGILDKTHLRFFTLKSIEDMFNALDYKILKIEGINPIRSFKLSILNALLLGSISDTKYLQFACVACVK